MLKNKKGILIFLILSVAVSVSTGMLYVAISRANDIKYGKIITASFHEISGKVIKKSKTRGGFIQPPDKVDTGKEKVFMCWDKDILNIHEDVEIYPSVTDVSNIHNAIFANTAYVPNGKPFSINLELGGIVECGKAKFKVKYDSKRLEFKEAVSRQTFLAVKHDKDDSCIEIVIDSEKNITSHLILSELSFVPIIKEYSYTELKFELESFEKYNNGGETEHTDCSLYHGKIYSY